MPRAREPEEVVYPRRRWPLYVLLLLLLAIGTLGGFVAFVRATHLATFRLDGPHACDVQLTFGPTGAVQHRTVTLPWETGVDIRGGDVLILHAAPSANCASRPLRCAIDVDLRPRVSGADTCAEYAGRVWAMIPFVR